MLKREQSLAAADLSRADGFLQAKYSVAALNHQAK